MKFPDLDKKLKALKAEYPQLSQAMTITESPNPHPSFLRVHGDYRAKEYRWFLPFSQYYRSRRRRTILRAWIWRTGLSLAIIR